MSKTRSNRILSWFYLASVAILSWSTRKLAWKIGLRIFSLIVLNKNIFFLLTGEQF